jgi:hypothetical protein
MTKEQKIISLFTLAIIWGLAEILIGNLLQGKILPVRGIILTGLSICALITARYLSKLAGSLILVGLIVALLKAVFYGTFKHSAIYAVILQATLAELIFHIMKNFNFASIVTSIFLSFYTFLHGIIMHGVFFSTHIIKTYKSIFNDVIFLSSIESKETILFFVAALHLLFGLIWSAISINIAKKIKYIIEKFIE